jgi:uncharacterized protein (DUF2062 family)
MGIVPIWGFQLMTAIGLSLLLRLNKALVIIAANISIPPCIPFILYGSMVAGSLWMGGEAVGLPDAKNITMDFIHQSFAQYVLGAITLAISAGATAALIAYVLLELTSKKKTNAKIE